MKKNKLFFENIKNISVENKFTWKDKVFLTFDVDWASDEILDFVLNIIEKYDVKATFFVTHVTKLLDRMKKNPNIELGIHPNFNYLLNGDFRYGKNFHEIIDYYLRIVPDAVSVRSHSITQNSIIIKAFSDKGLRYDCNDFIPIDSEIELKPWFLLEEKLIKAPYFWEDDIYFAQNDNWDIQEYINYKGIKIFDFHPIHVFLNTENIARYNNYKKYSNQPYISNAYVNNDKLGIRTFLFNILEELK